MKGFIIGVSCGVVIYIITGSMVLCFITSALVTGYVDNKGKG